MNRKIFKWEDLSVLGENKERGHAIAFSYDNKEDACKKKEVKTKYSLNGEWKFYYQMGTDLPENFAEKELNDTNWNIIIVPSVWQLEGYGKPYYYSSSYPQAINTKKKNIPQISHELQEYGIYRRTFSVPEHFKGKEIFLHFGAAKAALEVYVNGKYVGYSQGSMTPHEFDITDYIEDGENQVTAVVWRYSDGTYLEDQDMWFFSGIYREVYLYAEPKVTIRDFYMRADLDKSYRDAETILFIELESWNMPEILKNHGEEIKVHVKASIHERNEVLGETDISLNTFQQSEGKTIKVQFNHCVENPQKWSHEQPDLYTILLEWEMDGKRLIIHGVNRHDLVGVMIKKLGVVGTLKFSFGIGIISNVLMILLHNNFTAYMVLGCFTTFATIPMMCLVGVMTTMAIDFNEYKYGVKMVACSNSASSFGGKVGSGVGGSLIGWMLAAVGYDATLSVAPEATKMAIYGFSFIVPLIAFVVMYVLVSRFDLEKKLPQMREEVAKRKQEAVK